MKHYARTALTLALALASGTAAALGLGQIEVKSKLGEPFLAEIPIVSNDPSELENLQAELASPAVFARVGLQPPAGVVADLQFAPALDASGKPVIRVSSQRPVDQPLLTFLVSVDWGQGRLVREYSALVDAPRTVSAPLQPPVDEAVASAPNVIERPPLATPEAAPPPEPAPGAGAERPDAQAIAARPAAPAQAAVAPPPRRVAEPSGPGEDYTVRRGDTLSTIAARLPGEGGHTLDQAMIALLRANPDAFIGGNINRLKAGAVLRVPAQAELASVDAQQARQLVGSQIRQWREARRAVPQPATDAVAPGPSVADVAAASRSADARLEIVPPGAAQAAKAGTQSGIQAGGEGDMLRQELQQTRETLAARDAEIQELKSRIGELEQLQRKQQELIALKDSELAAAQQRLAQRENAQAGASPLPWLGGGAVLALALLGGWWLSRRRPARPVFRAPIAAAEPSLADAFAPDSAEPA
ncbi:type IV pilus assembly protein FimV, partial [Vulcaniibacterium tengchongense]